MKTKRCLTWIAAITFFSQSLVLAPSVSLADPIKFKVPKDAAKPNLMPIAKDNSAISQGGGTVDDLFPIDNPIVTNPIVDDSNDTVVKNGGGNFNPNTGNGSGNPSGSNSSAGSNNSKTPSPSNPGNSNNNNNANNNNNGTTKPGRYVSIGSGSNSNRSSNDISIADVSDQFQCNLFENPQYEEIISSLTSLNSAIGSGFCSNSNDGPIVENIVSNNKKIAEAVKALKDIVENSSGATAENGPDIAAAMEDAIRAATSNAKDLANNNLLSEKCRKSMSKGDMALAFNDLLNGLTPYAMTVASMTGSAAVMPFLVGGSIVTNAVASIGKIINEGRLNLNDPKIRRAIVVNTCQFIRIDQKYKFLTSQRDDQLQRISDDLQKADQYFSARRSQFSLTTNNLLDRRSAARKTQEEVDRTIPQIQSQLNQVSNFIASTKDSLTICQLGLQLSQIPKDNSYISSITQNLEMIEAVSGGMTRAQTNALNKSVSISMTQLQQTNDKQMKGIEININKCANTTRSLVNTLQQIHTSTKTMLKTTMNLLDAQLAQTKEFAQFGTTLNAINRKNRFARTVTVALDQMKTSASFAQSEIATEVENLRSSLFGEAYTVTPSPVVQWFNYMSTLHTNQVKFFAQGLASLRQRALSFSDSAQKSWFRGYDNKDSAMKAKDEADAYQLRTYNLQAMPIGTEVYQSSCRELYDVYFRWVTAVDHLQAIESFCAMVSPYVMDSRNSDAEIVAICRGTQLNNANRTDSRLTMMKKTLVKNYYRDWAKRVRDRINVLACPTPLDLK